MNIKNFSQIVNNYELYLLDLWGVIHDGTNLYPGVIEMLNLLSEQNKKVHFISNGPRLSYKVKAVLDNFGIKENLYNGITTSGDTCYFALENQELNVGKNYFFIGQDKDRGMIDDLGFKETNFENCDFIINHGPYYDNRDDDLPIIYKNCIDRKVKMLCVNPDLVVVKQTGEVIDCAGKLAKEYQNFGGEVIYFGKPYESIYDLASSFYDIEKSKTIAVGDSFYTDILGANNFDVHSCLITQGIFNKEVGKNIYNIEKNYVELCERYEAYPTYVVHDFAEFI